MNTNEIINQIPNIPRRERPMPTVADSTSQVVGQVLSFIAKEIPIKKDLQDTQALHKKLGNLILRLEDLIEANKTDEFTENVKESISTLSSEIASQIEGFKEALSSTTVSVSMPTEAINAVEQAVRSIKLETKDTITQVDIGPITRAINDLKPLIVNLERTIEDSKATENVKLEKKAMDYRKFLEYLDTDAKNTLAVRLTDGKEFYKGLAGAVSEGVKILGGGSSGNNFLDPNGSPTKAKVDSSGNIKVSVPGSIVTGTKTVTTAGTAVRITSTSTPCTGVWVSADIGTGSIMAVGDSSVLAANSSQRGIIIVPGNQSTYLAINDLSLLWVDAQTNGAKLAYAYLV